MAATSPLPTPPGARPDPSRAGAWRAIDRRDPAVSRLVAAWRRLSAGAPTLVACSGGADSVGLLLILRAATDRLTVAHVLHDLRPRPEAEACRDAARRAADACGLPFLERAVRVEPGNAEAQARRARYAALAEMAEAADCPVIASAHHARDQFEGVLMALLRGAGPRGLAPPRESRPLTPAATLIRLAERGAPDDLRRACLAAGLPWSEDATNGDTSRFRAALRHGPAADLLALRPGADVRAARSAELLRDAAGLVDDRARAVFGEALDWPRDSLRAERPIVLAAGLRDAFARATAGRALDRLTGDRLDPAVAAIGSRSGETRRFDWPEGLRLTITRDRVALARAPKQTPRVGRGALAPGVERESPR